MGKFRRNKPPKSESSLISNKQTTKMPVGIPKKSPLLGKSKTIKKAKEIDNGKILFAKTTKEKKLKSKKVKIQNKRNKLMNKFELIKKQRKAEIAKMNREKAAIIGDLKPLKDALPSLNELFQLTRDEIKTGISEFDSNIKTNGKNENSKRNRIKNKKTEIINRFNCFENLLKDSDYKKNPREAIAYHIKYTHNLVDE